MSQDVACIAIVLALESMEPKKKRKRTVWIKDWHKKRQTLSHYNLLQDIVIPYPANYQNFLRMDITTFIDLFGMVMPFIRKEGTNMRDAISASERLSSTLRLLALGLSFKATD